MPARFILSLDCEGKWGMADLLSPDIHATLSDARLQTAYRNVVMVLDEYAIPATFAFVGLFGESAAHFADLRPEVERLAKLVPAYLDPALADIDHGSREGWHGDWAVDAVNSARTTHEIGLHGCSHVPFTWLNEAGIMAERALFDRLSSPIRDAKTFIYPRNLVANVDRLADFGQLGYRLAPPSRNRMASLLSELNLFSPPERDPPPASPVQIPAGYFVNWQHGPRKLVPIPLSVHRMRCMMEAAVSRDAVVHLWLHPENIASAPRTMILLRAMVALAARYRDAGRCEIITQQEYCVRASGGDTAQNRAIPPSATISEPVT